MLSNLAWKIPWFKLFLMLLLLITTLPIEVSISMPFGCFLEKAPTATSIIFLPSDATISASTGIASWLNNFADASAVLSGFSIMLSVLNAILLPSKTTTASYPWGSGISSVFTDKARFSVNTASCSPASWRYSFSRIAGRSLDGVFLYSVSMSVSFFRS